MPGQTDHYGLNTLGAGDSLSDGGYKFSVDDRRFMDQLLYLGAEGHKHNGALSTSEAPDDTLTLTQDDTGGSIQAGQRIFYKYSYVDVNGLESEASTEYFIDTPDKIAEPNPPALTVFTTGGTLLPGVYYYAITAYTNVNTQETKAKGVIYITVPVTTSTNSILLELPSLPAGADGFNIYRRKPGASRYNWLTSTTGSAFTDTNSLTEDCNRTLPVRNITNSQNSVTLELPTLPAGTTWKIYRSFTSGMYDNALLHHVVEETFEGSGIITPEYVDVGNATQEGSPLAIGQQIGSPSKIMLTNGEEVQGTLPLANVAGTGFPMVIEHHVKLERTQIDDGVLQVHIGKIMHPIEVNATIVGCRATLGYGQAPAATDVIVDVNLYRPGATPIYQTIYSTQANRPRVAVGTNIGARTVPNTTSVLAGDYLLVDVDQIGGGATPTDHDLVVTIYLKAVWA